CLVCEHCSLDLGQPHYSDYTPGYNGTVDCDKNMMTDQGEGCQELAQYVTDAENCLHFKLHNSIKPTKPDDYGLDITT
ncbi:MAG: hypothetical protein ACXABY_21220, partial [Candidatus Thorarchaeota archaeon]